MYLKSVLIPSTILTLAVVTIVWWNRDMTKTDEQTKHLVVKTMLAAFISITTLLYFMADGGQDEVIENMIKTPPNF
jgi:flagellar basal body-associated protein FliL